MPKHVGNPVDREQMEDLGDLTRDILQRPRTTADSPVNMPQWYTPRHRHANLSGQRARGSTDGPREEARGSDEPAEDSHPAVPPPAGPPDAPRLTRSDRAQFAWTNVPLSCAWAWTRGTMRQDLRGNGNQHCHRQGLLEGQTSKVPDQGRCLHEHLRRGGENRDQ